MKNVDQVGRCPTAEAFEQLGASITDEALSPEDAGRK